MPRYRIFQRNEIDDNWVEISHQEAAIIRGAGLDDITVRNCADKTYWAPFWARAIIRATPYLRGEGSSGARAMMGALKRCAMDPQLAAISTTLLGCALDEDKFSIVENIHNDTAVRIACKCGVLFDSGLAWKTHLDSGCGKPG